MIVKMSTDTYQIVAMTERLLQNGSLRRRGLTDLEKLTIDSIIQNTSYRQASLQHQYTESSFQNAASRIFRELSETIGVQTRVNRRNFVELLEQEYERIQATEDDREIVFDRLLASLWIGDGRAQMASINYQANRNLDLNNYLVKYSPKFEATFCLDVERDGCPTELLWNLCQSLQIDWSLTSQDPKTLLELIKVVLQKRRTLLVLRFDRSPWRTVQMERAEYTEILMALALIESGSCVLTIDRDSMASELEVKRSLAYQLRLGMERWNAEQNAGGLRLVAIENDRQSICNILETYLK
jgi:hypothetical protein